MKRLVAVLIFAIVVSGCHNDKEVSPKAKEADSSKLQVSREVQSVSSGTEKGSVPSNAVHIAKADQPRAGIEWAPVTVRSMPQIISAPGQVAMDERHTEHIGALADGRIQDVHVLVGDSIRRGQVLATLHSHTVHETVAALTQAFAAVTRQQSAVSFATQGRERYARLFAIQAASLEEKQRSEQELAQAQKDLTDAEANVRAEREHLAELLQVVPETLKPTNLYDRELVPIRAVADGVVISKNVTVGQVVSMGEEAFVTSNLTTVWVNASVNEKDVPVIKDGAAADVVQQGVGTQGVRGTVTRLSDVVDTQTRTLPVRIVVPNPGTKLRPGTFVTASITVPATRSAIFIPSDALQDINGFRVVFLTPDGVTFYARAVQTGSESKGLVEVVQGLSTTDRVVVKGAFMVKGELLKGSVGEE